jgi:hypothetical protein
MHTAEGRTAELLFPIREKVFLLYEKLFSWDSPSAENNRNGGQEQNESGGPC